MMSTEKFTFTGAFGACLPARLWLPEGRTEAVLQITHGMTEHSALYSSLAKALAPEGIAVAAFDLRGHGENGEAQAPAHFGENGWENSLSDMHAFSEFLKSRFPGAPVHMLGFSLGSFLLREYLEKYPADAKSAVIMGTGHQPAWLLSIMTAIVKRQMKKSGAENTTPLVQTLSFGAYNAHFKPNRTSADWLIRDEKALDEYLADPLCRKDISSGLFYEMLSAMKRTGKKESVSRIPKSLPILLLSGKDDPVGDFGKGAEALHQLLKDTGHTNTEVCLIENARHILLKEKETGAAEKAIGAIIRFIKA